MINLNDFLTPKKKNQIDDDGDILISEEQDDTEDTNISEVDEKPKIEKLEDNTELKPIQEIPQYLIDDPIAMGYEDEVFQDSIYNFSLSGVLPLSGEVSMLDIGCGRADITDYISRNFIIELNYTGIELNQTIAKIPETKYPTFFNQKDKYKIINDEFLNYDFKDNLYDWVICIGSLNLLYYEIKIDKWQYINNFISKALDVCKQGVVLTLIHDTGGQENFVSYPIPNMADEVLKFKRPFTIQTSEISDIYRVIINKQVIL